MNKAARHNARNNTTTSTQRFPKADVFNSKRKMVPMSSEMKEVLTGLERKDLLPESEKQQELQVPAIRLKRPVKQQRKSVTEKPNRIHISQTKHLTNNPASKKTDIQLSSPVISIDDQEVLSGRVSWIDTATSTRRPRSYTAPVDYHYTEESRVKLLTPKPKLHVTLSVDTASLQEEILRPRASTFPLRNQQETSSDIISPSGSLQTEKPWLNNSQSSKSISKLHMKYPQSSQEEIEGILNRCENWFQWRETIQTKSTKTYKK